MSSLKLPKLRISVKAYEPTVLDSACVKIVDAVKASGIDTIGPVSYTHLTLPTILLV